MDIRDKLLRNGVNLAVLSKRNGSIPGYITWCVLDDIKNINAGRTFSETTMTKGNVSDWAQNDIPDR